MLETEGLTKRFPGVTALDGLTLSLEPGVIGLVGANGAGKSTLLKILLGLIGPTSGRATLFGLDIEKEGFEARRLVGYMPEHDCLPGDVSATEFVAHMARMNGLPRSVARERTADALRHVGLFEERYRETGGYSTGMKQRVKLAQALVHDPHLLLLDEPTNGLDPGGRDDMLDLIARIGRDFGISVIMASHLLGEIERVCDFLVVIDSGHLMSAAPVASFTAGTGSFLVELDGRSDEVAGLLRARGATVSADDGQRLRVDGSGEGIEDRIRDAVIEAGAGLLRLEPGRHALEELFRPVGEEVGHDDG